MSTHTNGPVETLSAPAAAMPEPESRSIPGAIESSAVLLIALRTCAGVQVGRAENTSAA